MASYGINVPPGIPVTKLEEVSALLLHAGAQGCLFIGGSRGAGQRGSWGRRRARRRQCEGAPAATGGPAAVAAPLKSC